MTWECDDIWVCDDVMFCEKGVEIWIRVCILTDKMKFTKRGYDKELWGMC